MCREDVCNNYTIHHNYVCRKGTNHYTKAAILICGPNPVTSWDLSVSFSVPFTNLPILLVLLWFRHITYTKSKVIGWFPGIPLCSFQSSFSFHELLPRLSL